MIFFYYVKTILYILYSFSEKNAKNTSNLLLKRCNTMVRIIHMWDTSLILLFLKNVSTSKNFHLQGGRFFSWNFQIALDKAVFRKIVRPKNEGCWSKLKIKLIILPLSTCTPFCSPRPKIRTNNFLIFKLKMLF